MNLENNVSGQVEIINPGQAKAAENFAPPPEKPETSIDCRVPADEPARLSEGSAIPDHWKRLVDFQFEGKLFGLNGFGSEFKEDLLSQVGCVKMFLEREVLTTSQAKEALDVDQINDLITLCDRSGSPEKTNPYVRQLLISVLREDIGRAYLRALQKKGEMLGASYTLLTAPPMPDVVDNAEADSFAETGIALPQPPAVHT